MEGGKERTLRALRVSWLAAGRAPVCACVCMCVSVQVRLHECAYMSVRVH